MSEGLERFVAAGDETHEAACGELRAGMKRSHWMWWTFPQIAGLGRTQTSRRFALRDAAEARAFLAHPVLAARLSEAMDALMGHAHVPADLILGDVDALKLRSSMTLFARVADDPAPFEAVLGAFHDGAPCARTLRRLAEG